MGSRIHYREKRGVKALPAFFVTGTDTDVGKTFAATALLRAAATHGYTTLGLKPVAAGCNETDDGLRNIDALAHMAASTLTIPYEEVNPVTLKPPIAPHIAAAEAGLELSSSELVRHCQKFLEANLFTLIEGAGGWLVPLNSRESFADFAAKLGIPVLLIVGLRLGCINHALLSAEAIQTRGLKLAGWIANSGPEIMERTVENITSIKSRLTAPYLGELPWREDGDVQQFLNLAPLLKA